MEQVRMLGLEGSAMFLVLSSLALKTTFQDGFGWLISDWAQTICLSVELVTFFSYISLCVHSLLKGTFPHGLTAGKGVVSLSCLAFFTAPPSMGNIVRQGAWKKGHIASGKDKPLQWLVILVLLTSHEEGSPTGNMVGCVFDLLTTS